MTWAWIVVALVIALLIGIIIGGVMLDIVSRTTLPDIDDIEG